MSGRINTAAKKITAISRPGTGSTPNRKSLKSLLNNLQSLLFEDYAEQSPGSHHEYYDHDQQDKRRLQVRAGR